MKRRAAVRVNFEIGVDRRNHWSGCLRLQEGERCRNEGSAGEGMRFGEADGRLESFTR